MQRRNGKKSTHLLAWIHAWQLGAQGRVPACSAAHLHHNVPLGQGLGPPGELLLLLLLSVNLLPAALVRERAGVGITAGGGVVGGQGEGGGRDAAGAVAEPAEEGAGAAAHKPRALGIERPEPAGSASLRSGTGGQLGRGRGARVGDERAGKWWRLLSSPLFLGRGGAGDGGAVHGQDTC
jgi:hypothetical protein